MALGTQEGKHERLHISISGAELKQPTELNSETVFLSSEGFSIDALYIDFVVR